MKTTLFVPLFCLLFVPAGFAGAKPAGLPENSLFATSKIEVPSLALHRSVPSFEKKTPDLKPENRDCLRPRSRHEPRIRLPDTKSVIEPKSGIDYKCLVKTPDPRIDYKLLMRETGSSPK
jgi:hypothetical protein